VDKTSNLLVDELAVIEGEAISMPLAHEAPGHWLTAVWQLACWQVGLTVDLTGDSPAAAIVTGRHWQGHQSRDVFACALHPFGFGFDEQLPDGVRDYALEVRAHPDTFFGAPLDPAGTAWVDRERKLSQADLVTGEGPHCGVWFGPEIRGPAVATAVLTAVMTGGFSSPGGWAEMMTSSTGSPALSTWLRPEPVTP
jgi:uncharacterized protein (TIGR03089 family)